MSDATKATTSKPKIGEAIYKAPLSTTLPTDATTELSSSDSVCLGYVSEDGIKNNNTASTGKIKAFGGDTIVTFTEEKPDTFKFTLAEALNEDVLKVVYGDKNVSGTLSTGITIQANSEELENCSWVVELVLKGGVVKRIVIPRASITEVGEISYSDADLLGYEVTLTALPDTAGNTHYEYIKG